MDNLIYIGQWQGFFQYGPAYGDLEGHEAEFRLFVEECHEGQLSGKIIDWEGIGANGEVAEVKGFVNGNLISFTKQYAKLHAFDEEGNVTVEADMPGHQVVYTGRFDQQSNTFIGDWEITLELAHSPHQTLEEVSTGSWRMHRHP